MLHPAALIGNTPKSPHPEKIRIALTYLHDRGAHFVMLTGKRPLWRGYMRRRPALESVLKHGALGIVPWSLRTSALDVDAGEPAELCECCPPVVSLATRRGWHCYYRDTKPRSNANFNLLGTSGQVRGAKGYLKLWNDGPVDLLHALLHNPDPCLYPADLLTAEVTKYRAPADPGQPYTRRIPHVDVDLSGVPVGNRNNTLFDAVRFWAYAEMKPSSMSTWYDAVRIYAQSRNVDLRRPLPVREVDRLALSVSSWVWCGGGPSGNITWSPEQRSRGGATRKRIQRFENRARDAAIVRAVSSGVSMRKTARDVGLDEGTIRNIMRRNR